jgi:hypothetical protein
VRENYAFSIGEICRDNGRRNLEIFEAPRFEDLFDEVAETVIAGKSQPRDAPSSDVTKTKCTASRNDARERRPAGISCAQNTADARTGDIGNGDAVLLENLQDAKMRESPRETAAQR